MRISAISQDINDISGNWGNASSGSKDVVQAQQNTLKVDVYDGSIPKDITYLTQVKNIPKDRKLSSKKNLSNEYQAKKSTTPKIAKYSNQEIEISKPVNILKTTDQIEKDSREMIIEGDLGDQIVRDIIVQTQKNIDQLNKFNLSKGNRLIKKVEISV